MKKIGIMGGTFDPVHNGHLIIAERAYDALKLDKVLFIPAGRPPHKRDRAGRADNRQRAAMTALAIEDNPHFALSLFEMEEEGLSYSYRTLEAFKKERPQDELYFIMGADSLMAFDTWMEPGRIAAACRIVVSVRDHLTAEEMKEQIRNLHERFGADIILLDTPNIDTSSSQIRQWEKEGRSLRYFVPDKVIDYIRKEGLYSLDEKDDT